MHLELHLEGSLDDEKSKGDPRMYIAKYAFCTLMLLVIMGCTRPAKESANQQEPPAAQQTVTPTQTQQTAATPDAAKPAPAAAPRTKTPKPVSTTQPAAAVSEREPVAPAKAPEEAAAPKPPEPIYAALEEGTKITVRLQDPLDTAVNKSGDTFQTILDEDIVVNGRTIAPRGSILDGKLSNVARSGRVEGRATMSLQLTNLTVEKQTYPLRTDILAFEAESTKKKDAAKVGIGAGIGAVIGAIAGGGKGAAIGAAVGGGAGGATVLATRGKEVQFGAEQAFTFVLSDTIKIRIR